MVGTANPDTSHDEKIDVDFATADFEEVSPVTAPKKLEEVLARLLPSRLRAEW